MSFLQVTWCQSRRLDDNLTRWSFSPLGFGKKYRKSRYQWINAGKRWFFETSQLGITQGFRTFLSWQKTWFLKGYRLEMDRFGPFLIRLQRLYWCLWPNRSIWAIKNQISVTKLWIALPWALSFGIITSATFLTSFIENPSSYPALDSLSDSYPRKTVMTGPIRHWYDYYSVQIRANWLGYFII